MLALEAMVGNRANVISNPKRQYNKLLYCL